MNKIIEEDILIELIKKMISEKYMNDKETIQKSISDLKSIIIHYYKKKYPHRILSLFYLRIFSKKLSQLTLLPSKEDYLNTSKSNELFDANMIYPIKIGDIYYELNFLFTVNVSTLSWYIKNNDFKIVRLNTEDLLSIMSEDYHNPWEYNKDYKKDILYEEKKNNPIIIMKSEKVALCTIINGNHRILHYSKMGYDKIECYVVSVEECCNFALTTDYITLYKMINQLLEKVKGEIVKMGIS